MWTETARGNPTHHMQLSNKCHHQHHNPICTAFTDIMGQFTAVYSRLTYRHGHSIHRVHDFPVPTSRRELGTACFSKFTVNIIMEPVNIISQLKTSLFKKFSQHFTLTNIPQHNPHTTCEQFFSLQLWTTTS